MPLDKDAFTTIMFKDFDAIQNGLHELLDAPGTTHERHVAAMNWIKRTLVPWLDARKDALLHEVLERVTRLEKTIATADAALRGR